VERVTGKEIPRVTLTVVLVTAAVSIAGLTHPDLLRSLQRQPTPDSSWLSWRLFTSLFVHDGWLPLAFNLVGLAIVGTTVERRMGAARWLVLYFVCGLVGEFAGIHWQPVGAGNSVATFGLVGALAAETLGHGTATTLGVLFAAEWVLVYTGLEVDGVTGAVVASVLCAPLSAVAGRLRAAAPRGVGAGLTIGTLALAAALCVMHDIHGPPLIVGAVLAPVLRRKS
jgi:membrane associated rhomboid family serine protease